MAGPYPLDEAGEGDIALPGHIVGQQPMRVVLMATSSNQRVSAPSP
jgi:hypothetical protein